jgi:phenylpropionate dioxygenase-like ring-hydroxylating dioxygenase large terminal subunit
MRNAWYIAAESKDLKPGKILARRLHGEGLVLFRSENGQAVALPDRCPHRNVQLSRGKLKQGRLQCAYHGWEFNPEGRCVFIPSLNADEKIPPGAHAQLLPICEQQNYVWVWTGDRDPLPEEKPFAFPHFDEKGWGWGRLYADVPNSVANVIENFIDCAHTGYIHGGLFRTPASHEARTRVQAVDTGVVIDIDEDQDKSSLLSRLLVKDKIVHQDSFILPSIVQVAYGFGPKRQMIGWQVCTPLDTLETRVYVHVAWQMGPLNPFVALFYPPIGKLILKQDLWVLANQSEVIRRHGEQFNSVPSDTANLWIRACRSRAEKGEAPPSEREKDVKFRL